MREGERWLRRSQSQNPVHGENTAEVCEQRQRAGWWEKVTSTHRWMGAGWWKKGVVGMAAGAGAWSRMREQGLKAANGAQTARVRRSPVRLLRACSR